jgi:hypothetical protein
VYWTATADFLSIIGSPTPMLLGAMTIAAFALVRQIRGSASLDIDDEAWS